MSWERKEFIHSDVGSKANIALIEHLKGVIKSVFPNFDYSSDALNQSQYSGKVYRFGGGAGNITFSYAPTMNPHVLYVSEVIDMNNIMPSIRLRFDGIISGNNTTFYYDLYKTSNMVLIRQVDGSTPTTKVLAVIKTNNGANGMICFTSTGIVTDMVTGIGVTNSANIKLPIPEMNKCFICNEMKDNEILTDVYSYNSNPSATRGELFYFGGTRYFILNNYLCVKA